RLKTSTPRSGAACEENKHRFHSEPPITATIPLMETPADCNWIYHPNPWPQKKSNSLSPVRRRDVYCRMSRLSRMIDRRIRAATMQPKRRMRPEQKATDRYGKDIRHLIFPLGGVPGDVSEFWAQQKWVPAIE